MKVEHGYLPYHSEKLHVTLYRPVIQKGVTVIAGPVGPEYMHCKASIRQLANALLEKDQLVIVFDWLGYGQSSGALPEHAEAELQANCLEAVVKFASTYNPKPTLVTLRSAALLIEKNVKHSAPFQTHTVVSGHSREGLYSRRATD